MKKQLLFEFIKEKTPNLQEIVDVKLKDTDDEYGFINEHYIVNCKLLAPDINIAPEDLGLQIISKTCLVNISEFNTWYMKRMKRKEPIQWID